jgi:hypothetical protein
MRFAHWFKYLLGTVLCFVSAGLSQSSTESSALAIARVKYDGGGDWYNDPSAIPNLCEFIQKETNIDIHTDEAKISILDESLFTYPILFLTGHGKITFSDEEAERLRNYLLQGGFLYADDDYGMDSYFRKMMQQVFPDRSLAELPFSHDIYHAHFQFDHGLPKIHEHDNKPPQGFGILDDRNRLMVFYTYETNISDGWVDPRVYNDPPEKRETALRIGTNIIVYALMH